MNSLSLKDNYSYAASFNLDSDCYLSTGITISTWIKNNNFKVCI